MATGKKASGEITLKGDVIHRGKAYAKGKHKRADLPEDFPEESDINARIANAGQTDGLKISDRSAAAAAAPEDEGEVDGELADLEEGEEEEALGDEGEEETGEEEGEEEEAGTGGKAKGKTGNAAGNKGNSGKPRTKPQGKRK